MRAGDRSLTCREANDFLAAYVAGELAGGERALFDAHLAECPDCVVFLRQYVATIDLAKASCGDDEPAVLPERLVRAILAARETPSGEAPRPRRTRRR